MKFEYIRVMNFENALRGMRHPKESYHLIDSEFGIGSIEYCCADQRVTDNWMTHFNISRSQDIFEEDSKYDAINSWLLKNGILRMQDDYIEYAFIGPQDMELAQKLIRGGNEHRKFLRQIFVSVDITAPIYWWKEFDTYKVGTTANSTSTMHKLNSKEITLDCFEIDDFQNIEFDKDFQRPEAKTNYDEDFVQMVLIPYLEFLRVKYNETKDTKYWKELVRWLPESWLQTRTITMTYENVLTICKQRRHHKLNEWTGDKTPVKDSFLQFARNLPYAQEFLFLDEYVDGTSFPVIDFS